MTMTVSGGGIKLTASASKQSQSIMSALDMKPQHMLKLFKGYGVGMESSAFMYSHMLGFSERVGGTTYYHTEKDASTAPLEYTAIDTTGQVSVYTLKGASSTYFYARVHDVVSDKDENHGFVTAVDPLGASGAGTVTVTYPTGVTAPTTTTDDGVVIISTRSFGEDSDVGTPALSRSSQYENHTQIIKDKVSTTSTAFTDETWVNYGDQGFYSIQLIDGESRMHRHIENMFMHGKHYDSVADPTSQVGGNMVTSQGLLDVAETRGTTLSAAPASIADWDLVSSNNLANGIKPSIPIWTYAGADSLDTIDQIFYGTSSELQNSQSFLKSATDNSLFKTTEAYGVYMNFKYLNKRYTYMFETNESWSDIAGYNAEGFGYSNKGIMVPIYKSKDGMTGKKFGTIGTRYKSLNGLNRRMIADNHNGFGSTNGASINEFDSKSTMWLSDIGAQFMGGYQYTTW